MSSFSGIKIPLEMQEEAEMLYNLGVDISEMEYLLKIKKQIKISYE